MIQFDGSYHNWFENGEYPCLLCAVDDATGRVYAQFSHGESFEEVFAFWKNYFTLFGKPEKIYVDCHATYKVHSPDDYWDEKRRTCFERGMRKLGVIVIFSKSPQGKGRVEKGKSKEKTITPIFSPTSYLCIADSKRGTEPYIQNRIKILISTGVWTF